MIERAISRVCPGDMIMCTATISRCEYKLKASQQMTWVFFNPTPDGPEHLTVANVQLALTVISRTHARDVFYLYGDGLHKKLVLAVNVMGYHRANDAKYRAEDINYLFGGVRLLIAYPSDVVNVVQSWD